MCVFVGNALLFCCAIKCWFPFVLCTTRLLERKVEKETYRDTIAPRKRGRVGVKPDAVFEPNFASKSEEVFRPVSPYRASEVRLLVDRL